MPEFFRDRFTHPLARPFHPIVTAVARASAAIADELITVHEPLRRLSIERGVDPERISVVMNSADGRLFDPDRHPRRAFMADGTLRLIHHSNLQRVYGLDVAVEGLARLRPGSTGAWTSTATGRGARGSRTPSSAPAPAAG